MGWEAGRETEGCDVIGGPLRVRVFACVIVFLKCVDSFIPSPSLLPKSLPSSLSLSPPSRWAFFWPRQLWCTKFFHVYISLYFKKTQVLSAINQYMASWEKRVVFVLNIKKYLFLGALVLCRSKKKGSAVNFVYKGQDSQGRNLYIKKMYKGQAPLIGAIAFGESCISWPPQPLLNWYEQNRTGRKTIQLHLVNSRLTLRSEDLTFLGRSLTLRWIKTMMRTVAIC